MLPASQLKQKRILIDPEEGWEFDNENKLISFFEKEIKLLEEDYFKAKPKDDFKEEEALVLEAFLDLTLDEPDEVWLNKSLLKNRNVHVYLKEIFPENENGESFFYVALAHSFQEHPTFIYLHYPTKSLALVEKYQTGDLVYDRISAEAPVGALEGDALLEGDDLALGMYESMLKVRGEADFTEESFKDYAKFRELTIEESDEIWRYTDGYGNAIVNFIKDFHETDLGDITYIVCTLEDKNSNTHSLLFSFPTKDLNLTTRYRNGENLQAEEVVQESSH